MSSELMPLEGSERIASYEATTSARSHSSRASLTLVFGMDTLNCFVMRTMKPCPHLV